MGQRACLQLLCWALRGEPCQKDALRGHLSTVPSATAGCPRTPRRDSGSWALGAGLGFPWGNRGPGTVRALPEAHSHSGTWLSLKVQLNPIQSLTLTTCQAACQKGFGVRKWKK